MNFIDFCAYLEKLQGTAGRNDMTVILAEIIGKLEVDEVQQALYLLQGQLRPKYDSLEFNFSVKLMLRALEGMNFSTLFNQNANSIDIQGMYKSLGDIGLVVEEVIKGSGLKGSKSLSIVEVYDLLVEISKAEGSGSQGVKIEKFQHLLNKVSGVEGKFLSRMIVGKMRLGLSDKTLLDALSWNKAGDKSLRSSLDHGFGVRADIAQIAKVVKENNLDQMESVLAKLSIEPGVPVTSKLVEREKEVGVIMERMGGKCLSQPKLDGLRAQIHYWTDQSGKRNVRIFSRNMENMTDMFPDLVTYILTTQKFSGVKSFVLDSEAIGFDPKTANYLPFQETIQRKRKHGIDEKASEIPIKSMAFDLLVLDDMDISLQPVEMRLAKLKKLLELGNKVEDLGLIELLETVEIQDGVELDKYFYLQVEKGLEGIIVKKFGTTYDPGTRNYDWIKLKASSQKDFVDTIDAVVLGYYSGTGTRSKFGIGAILIGIPDSADGGFKTVAKVGTGITDEQLQTIVKDLSGIIVATKPKNYDIAKSLEPDVYVEPRIVVVVEADEITRSNMHTASKDENGKGLSMRFPRLIEWNRLDKNPDQATSVAELAKMFEINKS